MDSSTIFDKVGYHGVDDLSKPAVSQPRNVGSSHFDRSVGFPSSVSTGLHSNDNLWSTDNGIWRDGGTKRDEKLTNGSAFGISGVTQPALGSDFQRPDSSRTNSASRLQPPYSSFQTAHSQQGNLSKRAPGPTLSNLWALEHSGTNTQSSVSPIQSRPQDSLTLKGDPDGCENGYDLLHNSAPDVDDVSNILQRNGFPPAHAARDYNHLAYSLNARSHAAAFNPEPFTASDSFSSQVSSNVNRDRSVYGHIPGFVQGEPPNTRKASGVPGHLSPQNKLPDVTQPNTFRSRLPSSSSYQYGRPSYQNNNIGNHVNGGLVTTDEVSKALSGLNFSEAGRNGLTHQHSSNSTQRTQHHTDSLMLRNAYASSQSRTPLDDSNENSVMTPSKHNMPAGLTFTLGNTEQPLYSPTTSDYRSNLHSPYFSMGATPPTGPESIRSTTGSGISSRTSHYDASLLDRKLRSLDSYQQYPSHYQAYPLQPNGVGSSAHLSNMRMNPLAVPYTLNSYTSLGSYSATPRYPVQSEAVQHARSPLLEDFRSNLKTNKRYELKDVYNHIVEFSGDQHGSRFIQHKLETANSDEKDQVFAEIQPNCLQLMTDIFGNYVIQKMFEHGNQSQKKALANSMRGHILTLSMQMYGCRVVQKAIEHVLTDQQAVLIKELDGPHKQILRAIRDQNGNHVVQKAIERIPAEHIRFIVEAHRGEVAKLATHTYGCRVIQRILEHCVPSAKRVILDELHGCVQPLITDSFGNYVVQHIIQNGEPDDRRRVVSIVQQQLLVFSKHKFASNVVEKCLEYADDDQKAEILRRLTNPDAQGQTPVLGLLRDQYGNYVIQKVFAFVKGPELDNLVREMTICFPHLKKTSYGKQVIAIEKLLYNTSSTSSVPSGSSRGSEPVSTNASSTIEGGITPPQQQITKHLGLPGQTFQLGHPFMQ